MSDDSGADRRSTGGYLSREERVKALLDAASELITEEGVARVNLSAIANRSGVSRQWLYEFFPDIDSLLAALYRLARTNYLNAELPPPQTISELEPYLKAQIDSYLNLPVAAAIVGTYAINGGGRNLESASVLRNSILENLEAVWIQPMVSRGFSREGLYASAIALMNSIFGMVIAVSDGLTTREVAKDRLTKVIDTVVVRAFS